MLCPPGVVGVHHHRMTLPVAPDVVAEMGVITGDPKHRDMARDVVVEVSVITGDPELGGLRVRGSRRQVYVEINGLDDELNDPTAEQLRRLLQAQQDLCDKAADQLERFARS